jgi:tetratricopeptide (TPR) repeat protein
MNKNILSNPIYRYYFIENCLFFSFNQTAFATNNASNSPLKSHSIHAFSVDSINLDTLLIDFNAANKLKDTLAKAQAFQKLGSRAYEDYPVNALRFFDSAQVYFKRLGKVKEQTLCLQNMAFTYEEKQGNTDKSLEYALSTVPLWQSINEEMSEANILKYIGFLYGKKAQYDSAFVSINTAIEKFGRLDNPRGVAVCYVDKARVFQQQGTLDSCVHYLSKAKKMWISFETPSRVFNINNDLLKVYMGYKATNNVNAIIAENDALYLADSKKDIYWRDVDAFLTLCIEYFDKNNDKARSGLFQMKKKKYLDSIKNK